MGKANEVERQQGPGTAAQRLVEMVEYQDQSVVSRTIVGKQSGTVTLFAFGEGQGLSEHTAPFDALALVVDGEAEITVSGQRHTVGEGEVLLMPANEPHSLHASQAFKMLLVMIRS